MSSKLAKLIAVALAIAAVLRVQLTRRRIAERSSHSDDDASVPSSMRTTPWGPGPSKMTKAQLKSALSEGGGG
jgi:hypothetical protein